ncbi:aldolase/citrate lyase family protein [Kitasatospora sp. CM 4170]|uniref:HpcH/HpaI aldolase/citrate lyase family protein n=1 Tax=Kitasatospora aburaviensis TaxID=67265 RepID=A0ABW1EXE7_9ACTN|nr:aldolase/citrate lyase family protein [Kitasatospora sp. CM 4170]WNM49540.1 aldolase/citrate lyase family protein [Kitasatospora sp. CM 4170]
MKSYASLLYTPALRLASVAEPGRMHADMLVLDLEDSTHPARKAEARALLADADLTRAGLPALGLRVNSIATPDGLEDMRTLLELDAVIGGVPIDVVFIPKIAGPGDVAIYRSLLGLTSNAPQICSFIETVDSVENAFAIAEVSDGLCFGQADLTAEMYAENATYLDYARARLCVAAARHRVPAIDTNSFELHDLDVVAASCRAAREAGFTGKAAIHPRQVPVIAEAFTVGPDELAEYRRVVADYDATPSGFAVEKDRVLAPPFVLRARRMLALHAAAEA